MDLVSPPPETFLGAERRESNPGKWYYHIGSPDPWALVFVYSRAPFGQEQGYYDVSIEFRLIGSRSDDQTSWSRYYIKDLDAVMTELTLEMEARLVKTIQKLNQGLEAIREHEPVKKLDFWERLAG